MTKTPRNSSFSALFVIDQLSVFWSITHKPFATSFLPLQLLIHRLMKLKTMAPLGDQAHPQPNIQEYIHKASLTAARQKESEGVGSQIIHSLKRSSCVVGWRENEFPHYKRHRAGSIVPETGSAFLRRSGQSCMTNFGWWPLDTRSKSSSRSRQRAETTWRIPLRLNRWMWCETKRWRTIKGMIGSIRLDSRGTKFLKVFLQKFEVVLNNVSFAKHEHPRE